MTEYKLNEHDISTWVELLDTYEHGFARTNAEVESACRQLKFFSTEAIRQMFDDRDKFIQVNKFLIQLLGE